MRHREKIALFSALNPDSAETGYPGAYQWFDVKTKMWRWDFVGSSQAWATEVQAQRQADSQVTDHPIGTRYRFVHVRRWIRSGRRWRAVIDYDRIVEVTKRKRVKLPCCYSR